MSHLQRSGEPPGGRDSRKIASNAEDGLADGGFTGYARKPFAFARRFINKGVSDNSGDDGGKNIRRRGDGARG